jgi:FdhD protein
MRDRPGSTARSRVRSLDGSREVIRRDDVAVEEPLEIRVAAGGAGRSGIAGGAGSSSVGGETRTVAVTMRTPGADFELAAGFLSGEGIIGSPDDVHRIAYCQDPDLDIEQRYNVVTVTLTGGALPDLRGLERHFYTSSACGVCGKASIEAIALRGCRPLPSGGPQLTPDTLYQLPDRLAEAQKVFASTGGLHAAGLFTADGEVLAVREDVGRHNAVDKLVGWALLSGRLPGSDLVLLVSGRASYEIVQKAVAAGIPVVGAVSAPSSLAVAVAEEFGLTLVGFLRGRRCNVYADSGRIVLPAAVTS